MRLLLALLLCLPALVRGQTVWTNFNGGSPNPFTAVFFPDGYTDEEGIDAYQHMQVASDGWRNDPMFDGIRDRLRTIIVHHPSTESGASYHGKYTKDTRYGSTFNYQGRGERLLVATKGWKAAADLKALGITNCVMVVVANSTIYGGSGGNPASVSRHASAVEITRHELGHNVAGLADEYTSAYPGWPCREHPNSSTNRLNPPWKHITAAWIAGSQYGCVKDGLPFGRAYHDCKMKSLNQSWCDVCRSHYRKVVVVRTSPAIPPPGRRTLSIRQP